MAKGNRGNLLQHWVLCDVISHLVSHGAGYRFGYVDCHAMEPIEGIESTESKEPEFHKVISGGHPCASAYDRALQSCVNPTASSERQYPSSLALLHALKLPVHTVIAFEICPRKADAIRKWNQLNAKLPLRVCSVDWRRGFPSAVERELLRSNADPRRTVTYVQLDPNVVSLSCLSGCENVSIDDVRRLIEWTEDLPNVVIQLSSYGTDRRHRADHIRNCVSTRVVGAGFDCIFLRPPRRDGGLSEVPWTMIAWKKSDPSLALEAWQGAAESRLNCWFRAAAVDMPH